MLIINVVGIGLILFVVWWFWLSKVSIYTVKAEGTKADNIIEILIKDGVYTPAYIELGVNQLVTLRFIRKDATPCAEIVSFNSLNISRQIPLDKPMDIDMTLTQPGEYEFTCQMGMYRGKVIAK